MHARRFLAAIVGVVVMAALLAGPEERPADAATGGGSIPVWAADFMTPSMPVTKEMAVAQAQRFDVIAATRGMYRSHVAAMKAANPNLTLLVYVNAMFAQSNQGDLYPDAWYMRDADGNKVRSNGWGNYLMKGFLQGWIDDVVKRCRDFMSYSGYDGCFLDMLGTAPVNPGYTTSLPINPATGKVWTKSEWLDMTTTVAEAVRASVAPRPVFGNGVQTGSQYFATPPSRRVLEATDGSMAEIFVRTAESGISSYRSETQWKQDVDMLVDAGNRGLVVQAMTKVWVEGTQAQKEAWHEYALGTFLLGYRPGYATFSFRANRDLTPWQPLWDLPLGSPVGPYSKVAGVYQRTFTNGRVLVNPTSSGVPVSLGGSYLTPSGKQITSVTVGPYGASLLLGPAVSPSPSPVASPSPSPSPVASPSPSPSPLEPTSSPAGGSEPAAGGDPSGAGPADPFPTQAPTAAPVADTAAPSTGITSPNEAEVLRARSSSVVGEAIDDVGVTSVRVSIRHVGEGTWLNPDGSWGPEAWHETVLGAPGASQTGWALAWKAPKGGGTFEATAVGVDAAGNVEETPAVVRFKVATRANRIGRPASRISKPSTDRTLASRRVTVKGAARAAVGVVDVRIAVRDLRRGTWLHPRGRFHRDRHWFRAELDRPGAERSRWARELRLKRSGRFRLVVVAVDELGRRQRDRGRRLLQVR